MTLQPVSAFDRSRGLARCIWLLTGVSSVLPPLLLSVCVCGLVRLVGSASVVRLRDVRYGLLGGGLVLVLTLQSVSAFDRSRGLARCIWLLMGVSSVLLPLLECRVCCCRC